MPRLRSQVNKLQTALVATGRPVCINTKQFYSTKLKKVCTKYTLRESGETLMETFSQIEIIKFLAGMLTGGDEE